MQIGSGVVWLRVGGSHEFEVSAISDRHAHIPSADPAGDEDRWSIGPLIVRGRALLAPMAGVTDASMRGLARRYGATLALSEMVAARGLASGDQESRIRSEGQGDPLHAVQIAGCEAGLMDEAARMAEANGAVLIDINMGCPAKRVTGGQAGSALMRDLGLATSLIRATVRAVRVPVTVKMRLGWDEGSVNAPELARRAEAEGVAMVTVHGRTRCQFYDGRADWSAVRAVKEAVQIPVVVNGDCLGSGDARDMLAASGADAVMIGRGALGQPWLVGDVAYALRVGHPRAPLPRAARLEAACTHYAWLLDRYGTHRGLRHARKHLAAYARLASAGHRDGAALARQLVLTEDPAAVFRCLSAIFLNDERVEDARAA